MLARTPQNGDGAEVVAAALRGGVLHPPGFPLLAWLTRIVVRVPLGNPVERIACMNAVCHAATLFLLLEILRRMGVRLLPRLTAGIAYATFPSIWYLSTQTEVFSLTYFLMALLTWLAIIIVETEHGPRSLATAIILGVVTGLGLAQHPIFVTGLASFAFAWNHLRQSAKRLSSPVVWTPLLAAVLVAGAAYLSLLALHRPGSWPDWGQLRNISDVVRHATRAEYGSLGLTSLQGFRSVRGIGSAVLSLARHWNILLLALVFAPKRGSVRLLWANLALACAFLFIARMPEHRALSSGVLERFEGTLLIPTALLLGLGLDRSKRIAIHGGALAIVLVGALASHASANSRSDDTVEIYRKTLAASLPADGVYLALQDMEVFYGVPTPSGESRIPISPDLYTMPWYREHVLSRLEPRVQLQGAVPFGRVLEATVEKGFAVYSTEPDVFQMAPFNYRREGLFLVASRVPVSHSPAEISDRMSLLCGYARQLISLPFQGHESSRLLYFEYADALEKYSHDLVAASGGAEPWREIAAQAAQAGKGLWQTTDARGWKLACDRLATITDQERNRNRFVGTQPVAKPGP
jgi:hypothetical protein